MSLYPMWLYDAAGAPACLVQSDEEKAAKRAAGLQLPPGWPDDGLGAPAASTGPAPHVEPTPKKRGRKPTED